MVPRHDLELVASGSQLIEEGLTMIEGASELPGWRLHNVVETLRSALENIKIDEKQTLQR